MVERALNGVPIDEGGNKMKKLIVLLFVTVYLSVFNLCSASEKTITATTGVDVDSLTLAIHQGDFVSAKSMIEQGVDVNDKNKYSRTPLMTAIFGYDDDNDDYTPNIISEELVNLLLDKGADVNIVDRYGNHALNYLYGDHPNILLLLLAKGADINLHGTKGQTVLMRSRASNMCKILLEKGANVNAKDNSVKTALMYASEAGGLESVRLLLKHGAMIDAQDKNGKSALMYAAFAKQRKNEEWFSVDINKAYPVIVTVLLNNGASPNLKDKEGHTALEIAEAQGHEDIVKIIRSIGVNE